MVGVSTRTGKVQDDAWEVQKLPGTSYEARKEGGLRNNGHMLKRHMNQVEGAATGQT